MSLTPRQRAEILRRYRHARRPTLRAIGQALGLPTSTISRVVREANAPRRNGAAITEGKVEWRIQLPSSLAAAADKARGHLSRSAYLCAVLARALDAEERREGP